MLFFVGIAFAALSRSMATLDTPAAARGQLPPLRVALVAVAALIPSGVLLLGLLQRPPWYQPLIIGAATLIVVLALARTVDVGVQLHRHISGERTLREAVTELAELRDASAIAPVLERVVGRLLGESARCRVAVVPQPAGWSDEAARPLPNSGQRSRQAEFVVPLPTGAAPPDDRRSAMNGTPAANASIGTANRAGSLRLVVDGDRASLGGMKPRLEVLANQAGFALERIRLNNDSIRHASEAYFRTLVHNSADVILIVNDDDTVRYASPSASAVFGSSMLAGIAIPELIAETHRTAARQMLRDTRNQRSVSSVGSAPITTGDWVINRVASTPALVEVSCRDLRGDPSIRGLVVTMRDVTRQRLLERELEYRAFHDPLTGLANRLPFTQRLNRLADRAPDQRDLGAVLYADIDDLKIVNDALGHDAGDMMLVAVGDRLRQLAAEYGPHQTLAARLSGDEFAVQIDHVADERAAAQAAQRLVELLGRPVTLGGQEVGCSASVGVTTTADADTGPDLLRNADLALYAAKRIGKGHWRGYQPSMRNRVTVRLEMRTLLERAIDDDALLLYYQPVVTLPNGEPIGFEALLRWRHPTRGLLAPAEFIDIAEESALIVGIGEWVLSNAMRHAQTTETLIHDGAYVAVNVSARQFRAPGFSAIVEQQLARTELRPDRLVLEITESLLLRDDHGIWDTLEQLRGLGVRVAIDDFGTGYSALSYLRDVPLDMIKLDRSFIRSTTTSRKQHQLVGGIVGLANILGLDVVAEGIETEQELDSATAAGCRYGQGFLFSPPLPTDELRGWLRTREPARQMPSRGHTPPQ
jgi:diguanylate cyclase (GGDEF)-like protein/PAS domain S-box-containing protein